MDDKLFADLLASAQEMVQIEKGAQQPAAIRTYERPDTKAIRRNLNMKQDEFAQAIGVSTSLVQTWEQHRRYPDCAPLKLFSLLEKEPEFIRQLQAV